MQRPPRTDRPGPMLRTPRSDHPTPIQRPPRTDRPGPMQRISMSGSTALVPRTPRSVSPTLMPRPPRSNPPAPMQMSPRSDSPALMPRPHRSEPSVPIQRPPRSNPPAPMQHPPQTDPSLMQSLPRTDSHVPMQRPPRIKPPAPMHRHPGSEALSSMHRGPRTEPSSTIQRPPRTEPPHPMEKVSHSDPSACMKRPPVIDAPTPMQRPPRTDPPAPIQIQPRDDQLASVQKNSTMVSNNGVEIHETCTTELRCTSPNISVQVTKNDSAKSLGLVGGAWNDPEVHLEKVNSQHGPETNSPKPLSEDGNLPVQGSPGAWRSLQPKETPESDGTDGDGELFIPLEDQGRPDEDKRKKKRKRKREEEDETLPCDLDSTLDQKLEDGAKQHNLTAVNVRNILHEVITNEHVVAMMKAAITETQDMPLFEPKMTRSKLKEVVQKGVVIPTWTLSPIKKASEVKVPQFVDIPLAEEDSSDEEYQPEEEEDDETAEESLLESDVESTASSPRGPKRQKVQRPPETVENEEKIVKYQQVHRAVPVRHVSAEVVPMGPPAPPKLKHSQDSTFMEKLHAVDEELASNLVSMESYQPLGASLVACRTRSKRTLKDVPIGQLEAELQAPDITPDMYDPNTADDEDWKLWLRSLMQDDVGNEDEADDEDDPEYNILEDLEEPDTEDLRNDRAVRITKKEVNELMEELFETFQDEMGFSHLENEIPEDEDSNTEAPSNFNTPQALRFEEPLVNLLNEQHRTVKAQLEFLRMKKTITRTVTAELEEAKLPPPAPPPLPCPPKDAPVLFLDTVQKRRLQQQMQQHVQLLTQMHLLTCKNPRLSQEADNARMFLVELSSFAESSSLAHHPCNPDFQSMFQPCNLSEALQLLPIIQSQIPEISEPPKPQRKNVNEVLILPQHIAWIMATRTVFMYPELLPLCALKPKGPRDRVYFTKGEDNLLALGLKHFEGTEFSKTLISKYLVTSKTAQQLTVRIKNLTMKKTPDNIIKFYKKMKFLPIMCKCCDDVIDLRPPVEREKHRLPFWLKASLPNIEAEMEKLEKETQNSDTRTEGSLFPLLIPEGVTLNLKPLPSRFYRKSRRQRRPTILKPLLIRPSNNISSTILSKTAVKPSVPEPVPIRLYKRVSIQSVVPVQDIPTVHPVHIATPRKFSELSVPIPSGGRGIQIMSVSQSAPLTQPKMMLPALSTQKFKKPPICRVPRRKMVPRTTGFKAAPLINSAPILFAVPNGALNLVSLGTTCGMMQPVNSGNGIPVTTLLLNPTSFPLNQTFVSPPLSQAVVTSPLPVSEDNVAPPGPCSLMSEANIASAGPDEKTYFKEEPIALEEEEKYTSITIKVEKEVEVQDAGGENGSQEQEGGNMTGEDGGPEKEVENAAEDSGGHYAPAEEGSCLAAENVRGSSDGGDDRSTLNPVNILHSPVEEKPEIKSECDPNSPQTEQLELNEDIEKQEIEESALPQTQPLKEEPLGCDDPGDMEEPLSDIKCSQHPTEEEDKMANTMQTQEVTEPGDSPKNTSSSTDCDVDMNSPVGGHHDSSSPPGPQEGTNDKDGQEEEEEEDFDELTQDDDEEEMSSASEESVLSVPELQETMEKLTWLASERRLSQEGDSEENSEPEEEEEEEEEEGEGVECPSRKEKTADEVAEGSVEQAPSQLHIPSPAPAPATTTPTGERRRGSSKVASSHRVRSRRGRGRGRASKDASKLLLLYDENILVKDPLREQKDMAFAQAYLNRVREVLHLVPGKYEQFLQLIYQFEMCREQRTAVDLYRSIRELLKDWPQLLKDFAAFLLPEQALECGLFEEQQAFDKSRKFLRQLEICFLENPTHHQKIIKLLQSCAECPQQEITKLKAQMWQLLKGHDHLQDEFSLFFDQLRPPASRMADFEVLNWTEDKMYKFDGFEEVTLPDVEEEEEPNKIPPPPRSKRRKEVTQGQEKEADWVDGGKDCPCACHEVSEHRMKRCKRRLCSQCSSKACESRTHRHRETPDRGGAGTPSAPRHGHLIREGGSGEGKGTVSEDRLTTGGRALMGNRETSIQDSNVPSQRSRSGVTLTESSDGSRQRTLRPGSRGGRRPPALKAPPGALNIAAIEVQDDPSKPSETSSVHSLSPSKHSQIPSPTSPHLGVSTSNTKECTPESEPADQSHKRDPSISQADEISDKEEQLLTVCAKNITVSSSGEKVILWTREADRVILTMCQEQGAREETFTAVSERLGNKSTAEVSQRFQELVQLFQTACVTSSDEEDDAGSTTEQLSDQDLPLSEEELED